MKLDEDDNGTLEVEELENYILSRGFSQDIALQLCASIDMDDDGTITTSELKKFIFPERLGTRMDQAREFAVILHVVRKIVRGLVANAAAEGTEDALLRTFAKVATPAGIVKRNLLECVSVRNSLKALTLPDIGEGSTKLTGPEIDMLITSLDRNGDGVVSSREFHVWIIPKRTRKTTPTSTAAPSPRHNTAHTPMNEFSTGQQASPGRDEAQARKHIPEAPLSLEAWSPSRPMQPTSSSASSPGHEPRDAAGLPVPQYQPHGPTVVREQPNYKGKEFSSHVNALARAVAKQEVLKMNVDVDSTKAEVYSLKKEVESLRYSMSDVRTKAGATSSASRATQRHLDKMTSSLSKLETKLGKLITEQRRLGKQMDHEGRELRTLIKQEVNGLTRCLGSASSMQNRSGGKKTLAKKSGQKGGGVQGGKVTTMSKEKQRRLNDTTDAENTTPKKRIRQPRVRPPPRIQRKDKNSNGETEAVKPWFPSSTCLKAADEAEDKSIYDNTMMSPVARRGGPPTAETKPVMPPFPPQDPLLEQQKRRQSRDMFEHRLAQSVERWEAQHMASTVIPVDDKMIGGRWKSTLYHEPRRPMNAAAHGSQNSNSPDSPEHRRGNREERESPMQRHMRDREAAADRREEEARRKQQELDEQLTAAFQEAAGYVSGATQQVELTGSLDHIEEVGSLYQGRDEWWSQLQSQLTVAQSSSEEFAV